MDVYVLLEAIKHLPSIIKWTQEKWVFLATSYYNEDIQIIFQKNYETNHWELIEYKLINK